MTKQISLNISEALSQDVVDKRIDILQRIKTFGSISEAARSAGISYKAAWQAIETLSSLAGQPLIEKSVGGASGGGARITKAGEAVLEASAALNKVRNQIISDIGKGESPKLAALASVSLRMSIRNIIPCTITSIHGGMSMCKVKMKVCEEQYLRSSVTLESQQLLGLKEGKQVLALFKASAASVSKEKPEDKNDCYLFGQVARLPQKEKGGEVTLRLPNGINVVGFVHGNHGLEIGSDAYIQVPEQSVVIALFG